MLLLIFYCEWNSCISLKFYFIFTCRTFTLETYLIIIVIDGVVFPPRDYKLPYILYITSTFYHFICYIHNSSLLFLVIFLSPKL